MDWSEAIILARRELRQAEEWLATAPHGDPVQRDLSHSAACSHAEQAMVLLARLLGGLQR
jgi:hypothetical protein